MLIWEYTNLAPGLPIVLGGPALLSGVDDQLCGCPTGCPTPNYVHNPITLLSIIV